MAISSSQTSEDFLLFCPQPDFRIDSESRKDSTMTDIENKAILEAEIIKQQQAVNFLRSVPNQHWIVEEERREKEMRLASLKFQLKHLNNKLDSQVTI